MKRKLLVLILITLFLAIGGLKVLGSNIITKSLDIKDENKNYIDLLSNRVIQSDILGYNQNYIIAVLGEFSLSFLSYEEHKPIYRWE